MKHILGPKFSRYQSLPQRIIEHFIDFRPAPFKAPNIGIGAGKSALLFPKRAIPQSGHVHALPIRPDRVRAWIEEGVTA